MSAEAAIIQPRSKAVEAPWTAAKNPIVIGKDVLELLSSSMYVDAMSIFREYVQNATDAIDQRSAQVRSRAAGKIYIRIDPNERRILIRDNGIGVGAGDFISRLINLGASAKRGTSARGFRGVGRLAGLGYCQELIFRSQAAGEDVSSEMRWDCRRLRTLLRAAEHDKDIISVVRDVVSVRTIAAAKGGDHFFEVELSGVVRHNNDRLLSADAVRNYLAQVAPVPFSPAFSHGANIAAALAAHQLSDFVEIRINDDAEPIYRPHRDTYEHGNGAPSINLSSVKFHELPGVDGDTAAIAWIAHHEYAGAIPNSALIKGLRIRSGNIQVGEHDLFEDLFPETRFNSWAVGEVHVIDRKLIPNGRRDHFEQSVHFENLQNQLAPIVRDIARECRHSSVSRKWIKAFELHKLNALERAKVVSRGGVSKSVAHLQANAAKTSLKAMHRVVQQKYLTDEIRLSMSAEAERVEARVLKMIKGADGERNPLAHYKPPARRAFEQVIGLIYDNFKNRAAAGVLVEKILSRLEADASKATATRTKPRRKK
jgi:molecular chaperone HtpG